MIYVWITCSNIEQIFMLPAHFVIFTVKRKHDPPETHGPVYDEVGPKILTNAQQLLEMKENIAYAPKSFMLKENPAYKAVEELKL